MTATPRIYGETAKQREVEGEVNLASMDDKSILVKTYSIVVLVGQSKMIF